MKFQLSAVRWPMVALLLVLGFAFPAFAVRIAEAAGTDNAVGQFLQMIAPYVVPVFGFLSVIIPDDKMPAWASAIINVFAFNFGNAANDPNQALGAPRPGVPSGEQH